MNEEIFHDAYNFIRIIHRWEKPRTRVLVSPELELEE